MASEYEIEVCLMWGGGGSATADDCKDALGRSGIIVGELIGECLIESVHAYPLDEDGDE